MMVDQAKVTKIRNDIVKFNNDQRSQLKYQLKNSQQKEIQLDLSWQGQKNDFSNSPMQKSQNQQDKEQNKVQYIMNGKGKGKSQDTLKSKLNQKINNLNVNSSQKLNQNLLTLQQIQEFKLQGKKLNDLSDKPQINLTPQKRNNISLESKIPSSKTSKTLNNTIDFCSQSNNQKRTAFPHIKRQQKKNLWQENLQPLSQVNIIAAQPYNISQSPQQSDLESRGQRKTSEATESIQKSKGVKYQVRLHEIREDFQQTSEVKEMKTSQQNNLFLGSQKSKGQISKRAISQGRIMSETYLNQRKKESESNLPSLILSELSQSELKINSKTQSETYLEQITPLNKSNKSCKIRKSVNF